VDAPGALDEGQHVIARGVGVGEQELGDGAGIAWQQFAVRPTSQTVVRGLDRFLGRDALLVRSRGPADTDQPGKLSDFESGVAVQQEMAEQAVGVIIVAATLPEGKGRLEQAALLGCQSVGGNLCLEEPACARVVRGGHEKSSLQSRQGEL
jgi:hypothetical protein